MKSYSLICLIDFAHRVPSFSPRSRFYSGPRSYDGMKTTRIIRYSKHI